jgi:hypothetical protein
MDKDLKGRECGKGICQSQRKDGLYSARFVNKQRKRSARCFSTETLENKGDIKKYEIRYCEILSHYIVQYSSIKPNKSHFSAFGVCTVGARR